MKCDVIASGVVEAAKQLAEAKGKDGWLFTLDYPSYIPFMTYSEVRPLREKLFHAYASRAFKENERNNSEVIRKIVTKRPLSSGIKRFLSLRTYSRSWIVVTMLA